MSSLYWFFDSVFSSIASLSFWFLICALVFSTLCSVVTITKGFLFFNKPERLAVEDWQLPGVSIVKPLMGVDAFLPANLLSHFTLDYPRFELLLCVESPTDPAVEVCNELIKHFPKVDAKVLLSRKDEVINPMVNNMLPGYANAKYPLVWICTSRVKISTEIMHDMIAKLANPKMAIVHQLPAMTDKGGIGGLLEMVYFCGFYAKAYVALNVFKVPCFTGMSYLFKKAVLDELGGLTRFGAYLAEDYYLVQAICNERPWRRFELCLAAIPCQQNVSASSVSSFIDRMVRWNRLRSISMPFTTFILETSSQCTINTLLVAIGLYHYYGYDPYRYFAVIFVLWFLCDLTIIHLVHGKRLHVHFYKTFAMWLFIEVVTVYVCYSSWKNIRDIRWGHKRFAVDPDGKARRIH